MEPRSHKYLRRRRRCNPCHLSHDEIQVIGMSQLARLALVNRGAGQPAWHSLSQESEVTEMRSFFAVLIGSLSVQICSAAEVETSYYVGEIKLSSESGQPLGSQAMLTERTYDPGHGVIGERAIVVKPDGTVDDYPMSMNVKGDTFTLDDPKKFMEGTGTLFGPA